MEIIKEEFTLFPVGITLEEFNEKYAKEHKGAKEVLAVARVRKSLGKEGVEKYVVGVLEIEGVGLEEGREGLELLRKWGSADVASYVEKASKKWPGATGFEV